LVLKENVILFTENIDHNIDFNPALAASIVVAADDAGLEAGIFGNGVIRTPHLDALGSRSVRFTNAFASVSSCSPR
jgi:N-sulfoglucosamine sulfohydrolase